MALTPNDVLRISEPVEKMYMDCTSQLIINLSRHFATDKALPTAEWETKKLSELGELTNESIEIIAANTGKSPQAIKKAVTEGMGLEIQETEKILSGAAAKGKIQSATTAWDSSEGVKTVLNNLIEQADEDANIVNTVMLNSTRERYVNAVQTCAIEEQALIEKLQSANMATLETQLAKTQTALNASTMSVAVGAEARTTALRRTINQLAEEGITGYVDKAGHHWTPEAYINMDIRTTVHNAAIKGQEARSADYGVTTFQISSHAGARPLCAPYQGKIYSWDGSSGTIEDLYGNTYSYVGIGETSYGQAAGIFGINCGHRPVTFVDGYSVPRFEPTEDMAKNDEEYRISQEQRYLERQIRDEKTKALAYDAAGDKEAFAKSAQRVKEKQANYKEFCDKNDRTPRNDRTQVVGYNRQMASKANAAAKKAAISPNDSGTNMLNKAYDRYTVENNLRRASVSDLSKTSIVGADYGRIPAEIANGYNKTFNKLVDEYNSPLSKVRMMDSAETLKYSSAFATTRTNYENGTAEVLINPLKNKDAATTNARLIELGEKGYAVKVPQARVAEYQPTHEFAHTLVNTQTNYSEKRNFVGVDIQTQKAAQKEITALYDEYRAKVVELERDYKAKELDVIMGNAVTPNAAKEAKQLLDTTKISTYSLENADEFMAEAFVNNKIGSTPNIYADRAVKIIDRYFKR